MLEVRSAELVTTAAEAGFSWFSMFAHAPVPDLPADPAVKDADALSAMKARMAETGLQLLNLECFNLTADAQAAGFAAGLECGGQLGARTATAIVWENGDRADAIGKFRTLCDMAAEHGITVNLEFFIGCDTIRTIADAASFVAEAKRGNGRIVIDLLHLMRTSRGLNGMRGIPAELIGGAQICDGPAIPPLENPAGEAIERGMPGEGAFPISEFLALIPPDMVIGVEVPIASQFGKVAPATRARRLYEAAERFIRV